MQHLLNKHVQEIEISGIRKFFNMVSTEDDIISLTIGQPDFQTPEHIKQASIQALMSNQTSYTHNAGILPLRKAISHFYESNYELSYSPENEVIVTVGASQAIDITFRTILNPGDEVLLPAPIYPGYEPLIRLAGAIPIYMDTTKTNLKLTKEILKQHITSKTKCVILPYPSNPTGMSYNKKELAGFANVLKDQQLFVLADEIYSQLSYDYPHTSIASFSGMKEKTIVINGVSKSHSMTGFRIGYTLAPDWISKQLIKVHQYNVSCATSISQYGALEALTEGLEDTKIMKAAYHERRDYVYDRLHKMGLHCPNPNGAFYMFPYFPFTNSSSFTFGIDLVKQGRVALVPGDSFSKLGEGYMRLSYAYDKHTLNVGLDRLEAYLQQHPLD
ncbi:aminotransferase A [Virgibacillus chiguensis]|uniref:Aminotransferase n=1 Tax=Virgibacillus chiguensis TaxID=411959 RepID=A0A1M5NLK4_9BACI|nr:aminotransferase A [Virgibacillus chiguensis]SHG90347.1 aminotransferase [Virgibacillus chiguensis]